MGRVLLACLAARAAGVPRGHDDINLERNQFGRESGVPVPVENSVCLFRLNFPRHRRSGRVSAQTPCLRPGAP